MFILRQINSIAANILIICFAVAFTSIATVLNWAELEPLQRTLYPLWILGMCLAYIF